MPASKRLSSSAGSSSGPHEYRVAQQLSHRRYPACATRPHSVRHRWPPGGSPPPGSSVDGPARVPAAEGLRRLEQRVRADELRGRECAAVSGCSRLGMIHPKNLPVSLTSNKTPCRALGILSLLTSGPPELGHGPSGCNRVGPFLWSYRVDLKEVVDGCIESSRERERRGQPWQVVAALDVMDRLVRAARELSQLDLT
jgi:hypothetical protein